MANCKCNCNFNLQTVALREHAVGGRVGEHSPALWRHENKFVHMFLSLYGIMCNANDKRNKIIFLLHRPDSFFSATFASAMYYGKDTTGK